MRITANISTSSPSLGGNVNNDNVNVSGNMSLGSFDPSNLKIRVTNLENNAVGTINLSYNNQTSILTLTTKNTKNEDIGTPQTVMISGGIKDISYDDTTKSITITLANDETMTISLKESFDEIEAMIPVNVSDLQNDIGFITNTVDNLVNYYKKSETYTQTEIDNLIAAIPKTKVEVVQTLPTASATYWFNYSHTIYLAPKSTSQTSNIYDEYICMRSGTEGSYTYAWEKIGDTEIDLSNYVQKTTTIAGIDLQDNITTAELQTALTDTTHNFVTTTEKSTWTGKQDALVSGTNIKTINNESILGSGNITINSTPTTVKVDGTSITSNYEADILTMNGDYNSSTNKMATANDVNTRVQKEITTTQDIGGTDVDTYNNVDNTAGITGLGSTFSRKFDVNDGTEIGSWLAITSLGIIMMYAGTASSPDAQAATSSINTTINADGGITITQLKNNVTTSITVSEGNITANSFVKTGGTSSQFLKADGSVDSNTYALNSDLSNYVKLSAPQQTIETSQSGIDIPLIIKSGMSQATTLGFMNVYNALIGYLKVDNQDKIYFIDSNVNEHELAFKSNIPTKTSDLNNDSGFITNSVNSLTNYYDKTLTDTLLSGKQSSLSQTQLNAVNSGIDSTKVGQITTNQNDISTINGKIPSTASSSNKLTDESFVNSSINALAAFFITRTALGDNFNTYAQLSSATTFYSGGQSRIPTQNDYTYVRYDETKGEIVSGYTSFTTTADYIGHLVIYNNEGVEVTSSNKDSLGITPGTTIAYDNLPTTRYSYQGGTYPNGQWDFQLIVNNSALTSAQMAALNSGITSSLVTQITTNQTNITNKMDKSNPTGTGVLKLNANPNVLLFGDYSASIGYLNAATNRAAVALNYGTAAQHESSTTMGRETQSSAANQLVFGKYNSTTNLSNALEIVGNGTAANNRSNARTLDTSGNEKLAGWLTMNGSVKAVGYDPNVTSTTEQTLLDNYYTKSQILNVIYPVGSIYMSVNNVSPASFIGGTWEQLKDRFLLGCGDTYSNGSTGGEATHTLTINEMPSHNHSSNTHIGWQSGGGDGCAKVTSNNGDFNGWPTDIYNTGGGQAHNNMPPYLAVYMWKRTQ